MKKKQPTQAKGNQGKEDTLLKAQQEAQNLELLDQKFKEYKEKMESRCFNFMQTLKYKLRSLEFETYKEFIIQWLVYQNQFIENHFLSGKELSLLPEEMKAMANLNVLPEVRWPYRFHRHFISRLSQVEQNDIYYILMSLERILNGVFEGAYKIELTINQSLEMCEFLVLRNFTNKYDLLFMVGKEQNPVLNRTEDSITKFQFRESILIIDLAKKNTNFDTEYLKMKYDDLLNDPSRVNMNKLFMPTQPKANSTTYLSNYRYPKDLQYFFSEQLPNSGIYKSDLLTEAEAKKKQKEGNTKEQEEQKQKQLEGKISHSFEDHFLSFAESQAYEYDPNMYRWVLRDVKLLQEKHQEKEERAQNNKLILSMFADFSSASNLVELLQKIPNLNLKLTEEEIDVIGQQGNVMVIGRSGTGKTTCAMLRLFAMEILFHIRVQIYVQKNTQILQDAVTNQQIGMQSVFITASPVLANQIKKYYIKLVNQVKEEIQRKQKLQKKQEVMSELTDTESISNLTIQEAQSFIEILNGDTSSLSQEEQLINQELEKLSFIENKTTEETEAKGIGKENEDDDQFEEDDLNDRFVMSEQGSKFKSLQDMKAQDFPAFLTVRQYLMLIEGCLHAPFFLKDKEGKIVHQEGSSSWGHYKSEKQMRELNQGEDATQSAQDQNEEEKKEEEFYDYQDENLDELYKRQLYLQTHQQLVEENAFREVEPSERKFEVDYTYFANAFWPIASAKFKDSSLISCNSLWTEIYSYIKGSSKSFSYPFRQMTREDYIKLDLNALLSEGQKHVIYTMFEYYEKWKSKQSGYDLMDLVNYLLQEVQRKKCELPSIHYTMIDEVQDLPYAIITLFSMVNEQNLFLAGDSAQTIARGVGFKFGDLKNVFKDFAFFFDKKLESPTIRQLTVNFRSHNKILQLSNSVISLIEGFFPSTIDILKKERSNIDGLKPIVLTDSDLGFLFTLLQGQQSEGDQIPLEFGCNQVILVKDEDSKKKLPQILQHAICLTIYEAKGLEFDDVILFNFFSDSACSVNQWEGVNLFGINKERMTKETFLKVMTMHNSVFKKDDILKEDDPEFANAFGVDYNSVTDTVTINTVVTKSNELKVYDRVSNAILCSELKQLYTAITRPKKRLIIFDQKVQNRVPVDKYWGKQNLVSFVSQKDVEPEASGQETASTKQERVPLSERELKEKEQIVSSVKKLLVKNTSSEWYEQGIKMFRYKYFEQAVKCFKKSGHVEQEKKAQAYFEASINSQNIVTIENNLVLLKKGIGSYALYNERAKKDAKKVLQKDLTKAKNDFIGIANKFLEINRKKQAAQCFFSGGQFDKAGLIYIELNLFREAAESFYLEGNSFNKAAELYEQINDIHKAIQCFDHTQDWNSILLLIKRNSPSFVSSEQDTLLKKYTSLAFQTICSELEAANKPEEEQQDKEDEAIQENESDESFSSFDSDHIDDLNEEEEELEEENNEQAIQEMSENQDDQQEDDVEVLEENDKSRATSKQAKQNNNTSALSSSYSVVNKGKSSSGISDISFDHLSHIDPNDEWLRVDNGSVFEKLNISRTSQNFSHSEFSVLDNSILGEDDAFQIIKTKENIDISDSILIKILKLLAISDQTFKYNLINFLKTQSQQEDEMVLDKNIFVDDLKGIDNLDLQKLNKALIEDILTQLQKYNQSKIALMLCNRYKMYDRVGQILVALSFKYSPLIKSNAIVQVSHFNSNLNFLVKKQKELSFVSNTALHSIFESINYELISKNQQENCLFNEDCIRALLLLGYWKRIIFLIDRKHSLKIAQAFGDFVTYRLLAADASNSVLSQTSSTKDIPKFNHLSAEVPVEESQIELAIMSLEHYIYHFIDKKFVAINSIKQLELPTYFKFNRFIWRILNKVKQVNQDKEHFETLKELIQTANSILTKSNKNLTPIQIFDAITAFHLIIVYDPQFQILSTKLPTDIHSILLQTGRALSQYLKNIILKYDSLSHQILRAILTVYQIRVIPNSNVLDIFGRDRVIIQKSNSLASQISKNTKLLTEQGNMNYCDIDFEKITAPITAFTSKLVSQVTQNINAILQKLNSSHKMKENDDEVNVESQETENKRKAHKNETLSLEQKIQLVAGRICSSSGYKQEAVKNVIVSSSVLLQFGQTQQWNEAQFKTYTDKLAKNEHLLNQILVNLVINYSSNKKIKLLIPQKGLKFYRELEQSQALLIDTKEFQNLQKANKDSIILNLNDYDNFEDLDELCQVILRIAEDKPNKVVDKEDIYDLKYQNSLFDYDAALINYIFTILANFNDAEKESLYDLIKALKLINFESDQLNYLKTNKNYNKLLKSDNIDDIRDAVLDLMEEEEFENYFEGWTEVSVVNHATPEANDKKYQELPTLIKSELAKRKEAGLKIYRFLNKNKVELNRTKQIFSHVQNYFDFMERQAAHVNDAYTKSFVLRLKTQDIDFLFSKLRSARKQLHKTLYEYTSISEESFSALLHLMKEESQLFNKLSDLFHQIISGSDTYKYFRFTQAISNITSEILSKFDSPSTIVSQLLLHNVNPLKQKKKFFENVQNSKQSIANQKVLALLRKRQNILKQQKIMELKSFKK